MKKVVLGVAVAVLGIGVLLYTEFLQAESNNSYVTYELSRGRFGDNIRAYALAKVVAEIAELPLLLTDFEDAQFLQAMYQEPRNTSRRCERSVPISHEQEIIASLDNTVYRCLFDFSPRGMAHIKVLEYCAQHPEFAARLRQLLSPVIELNKIDIPEGYISVAVHIRSGSGGDKPLLSEQYYTYQDYEYYLIDLVKGYPFFDKNYFITSWDQPYSDQNYPLKYPPRQYYVDQIKKIVEITKNKPLFVCLFTDHERPDELIAEFNQQLMSDSILIACPREHSPSSGMSFLEDYYNISRFDCLIRSDSHFAVAAQFLGNHKLVIYPEETRWINRNRLVVHKVGIIESPAFKQSNT